MILSRTGHKLEKLRYIPEVMMSTEGQSISNNIIKSLSWDTNCRHLGLPPQCNTHELQIHLHSLQLKSFKVTTSNSVLINTWSLICSLSLTGHKLQKIQYIPGVMMWTGGNESPKTTQKNSISWPNCRQLALPLLQHPRTENTPAPE